MNRKILIIPVLMLIAGFWLSSCKKDHSHDDEGELITTVQLKIKDISTNTINSFSWKDVDGDGGNAPVIEGITLSASKTYEMEIKFLDESKSPAQDITDEIKAESDDHEVFYQQSNSLVNLTRTDKDNKNLPLGLQVNLVTTSAGTGNLRIILKHKPGTKAAGDDSAKGETDIDINFPLTVN